MNSAKPASKASIFRKRECNDEVDIGSSEDLHKTKLETYTILDFKDITTNIPKNASKKRRSDNTNCTDYVEWRWRFFNIEGRKMVEISYKTKNGSRIYTDYTGKTISYDLDSKWDVYVVNTLYAYTTKS